MGPLQLLLDLLAGAVSPEIDSDREQGCLYWLVVLLILAALAAAVWFFTAR